MTGNISRPSYTDAEREHLLTLRASLAAQVAMIDIVLDPNAPFARLEDFAEFVARLPTTEPQLLSQIDDALAALPEDEQRAYRECQESVVRARRDPLNEGRL